MVSLRQNFKKILLVYGAYFLIAAIFYLVAGEQIQIKHYVSQEVVPDSNVGELTSGSLIEQELECPYQNLEQISLEFMNYMRENSGEIFLQLKEKSSGKVISETAIDVRNIEQYMNFLWTFNPAISVKTDDKLLLSITSNSEPGKAVSVYYDSRESYNENNLYINGNVAQGTLAVQTSFSSRYFFGKYFWQIVGAIAVLSLGYYISSLALATKGHYTLGMQFYTVWNKYGFLIRQLVSRDFKTKYKRSVLGYLWSFLNPLMTMTVQYVVFSQLFRSDIANFPVYLLSGIVLFGFFTEGVGQGLSAILANASLITKVYVPKYIYPVTKVVSSSINLFISLIPLLIVVLLTGQRITKAIILLPFPLLCLLIFCIGMSFMLSTSEVFFRDTQYLWGVATLAWTYATPLFYPENIIPERVRFIQTYNPMYHFIKFVRIILMDGVSPTPEEYLYCLAFAFGTLLIGALIFKKFQNKFVLYI